MFLITILKIELPKQGENAFPISLCVCALDQHVAEALSVLGIRRLALWSLTSFSHATSLKRQNFK